MAIETVISFISKIIIFVGLYFCIYWILVMLNSFHLKKESKIKNWPEMTILIPAYNEENTLAKTVESCLKTKYGGKLKVLIVNDGSRDNTAKIAIEYEKKYSNIQFLDLKKNRGKAGALNEALKKINTEFFAVIDADCEFREDTVKYAVKTFYDTELNHPKSKVGGVVCQMKPANENRNILERIQLMEYMMTGLSRYLAANQRVLEMTNGGSFYRTKIVKSVGGFDTKNLTEDFEMGVKIKRSGHLIIYSQKSKVYTQTPNNIKQLLKQRIRWARGFLQTHKKHKSVFFNPKYGLFGMYQFPMNIIGPILYFLAIFTISFKVYQKLYEFIFKLIYTPDLISFFEFDNFKEYVLGLDPQIDFLLIFSFLFLMFLYYGVMRFYDYNYFKKDTLKKIWAFIVYIMFYNYIYIYVWITSLIRELRGAKYSWGTK